MLERYLFRKTSLPWRSSTFYKSEELQERLNSGRLWGRRPHYNFKKTIAGFHCHAIQNRSKSKSKPFNRLSPESGKWTEVNIQRFAKIQARGIFRIRDIRRNVLPKFIEICMETPCWCPPGWAPTWRTETNKNICYRILVQKREFIPRGTHKH